ncbi:hypothetical protein FGO68_gene12634 [Halteria grandinella]|uniref:Uncharacterized protein n=1 Tax=Halteria grandinella TaxID=5974 RepID=A0A8J8P1J8_HALGN|nr:hypothetical protein FGO68_gene12634 [Halteria grandinella]
MNTSHKRDQVRQTYIRPPLTKPTINKSVPKDLKHPENSQMLFNLQKLQKGTIKFEQKVDLQFKRIKEFIYEVKRESSSILSKVTLRWDQHTDAVKMEDTETHQLSLKEVQAFIDAGNQKINSLIKKVSSFNTILDQFDTIQTSKLTTFETKLILLTRFKAEDTSNVTNIVSTQAYHKALSCSNERLFALTNEENKCTDIFHITYSQDSAVCELLKSLTTEIRFFFEQSDRIITDTSIYIFKNNCLTYIQNLKDVGDFIDGISLDSNNILLIQQYQNKMTLLTWSNGYSYTKATKENSPFGRNPLQKHSSFKQMQLSKFDNLSIYGINDGCQLYQIVLNRNYLEQSAKYRLRDFKQQVTNPIKMLAFHQLTQESILLLLSSRLEIYHISKREVLKSHLIEPQIGLYISQQNSLDSFPFILLKRETSYQFFDILEGQFNDSLPQVVMNKYQIIGQLNSKGDMVFAAIDNKLKKVVQILRLQLK